MRLAKDLQVKNLWGKKTAEQTAKTERGPSREIKIASAKISFENSPTQSAVKYFNGESVPVKQKLRARGFRYYKRIHYQTKNVCCKEVSVFC